MNPKDTESWETEFDKEFVDSISIEVGNPIFNNRGLAPAVKSFIRALLAKREGEVRREAVEYIREEIRKDPPFIYKRNAKPLMIILEAASKGGEISKGVR